MHHLRLVHSRNCPVKQGPINAKVPAFTFPKQNVLVPFRKPAGRSPVRNRVELDAAKGGNGIGAPQGINQRIHRLNHKTHGIPTQLGMSTSQLVWMHRLPYFGKLPFMGERTWEAIGARLRVLRLSLEGQPSQTEFARSIGIGTNRYNNWENGKAQPPVSVARQIVDRYRVTLDWIYDGRPEGLPQRMYERLTDIRKAV